MIPIQKDADMDNPKQHFTWALVHMQPEMNAPLLLPLSMMETISEHLYKCGFRFHAEEQEIFYSLQTPNPSLFQVNSGKWLNKNELETNKKKEYENLSEQSLAAIAKKLASNLTAEQLEAFKNNLGENNGNNWNRET